MPEAAATAPADQTNYGPLAQTLYTTESHLCTGLQKIPFASVEWVGNTEPHTWLSPCMCSCSSCQMTVLMYWNYFGIHSGTFFHLMKCLTGQAGSGKALELTQVCGSSLSPPRYCCSWCTKCSTGDQVRGATLQSPIHRFSGSLIAKVTPFKKHKLLVTPLLLWFSRDLSSMQGASRLGARLHQVEQHFG